MLVPGAAAPSFELSSNKGDLVALDALRADWVVLWWYPDAGTKGCSIQAASLNRVHDAVRALGAHLLGASFNSIDANDQFACDLDLDLTLLSDPTHATGGRYDVLRGPTDPHPHLPRRVTYYIDPAGVIAAAEDASAMDLSRYGEHVESTLKSLKSNGAAAEADK